MTLYFAAARLRGTPCLRATEQDRLESWLCDQTAAVPGQRLVFVLSIRRHRALSVKAGHGPLDRRRQRNHAATGEVLRWWTRLRQPCNLCDSACGAASDKCAFMMRRFARPNV